MRKIKRDPGEKTCSYSIVRNLFVIFDLISIPDMKTGFICVDKPFIP